MFTQVKLSKYFVLILMMTASLHASGCRKNQNSQFKQFANGSWQEDPVSADAIKEAASALSQKIDSQSCQQNGVTSEQVELIKNYMAKTFAKVPKKVREYFLSNSSFRFSCAFEGSTTVSEPGKATPNGMWTFAGDTREDPKDLLVRLKGNYVGEPSVGETLLHELGHATGIYAHESLGFKDKPSIVPGVTQNLMVTFPTNDKDFVAAANENKTNDKVSDYARGYLKETDSVGNKMTPEFYYFELFAEAFLGYYYSSDSRQKMCEVGPTMCTYFKNLNLGPGYWETNKSSDKPSDKPSDKLSDKPSDKLSDNPSDSKPTTDDVQWEMTLARATSGQLLMFIYATKPVTDIEIKGGDGNWYPANIPCQPQGWSIIRALPVAEAWRTRATVDIRAKLNGSTVTTTQKIDEVQ